MSQQPAPQQTGKGSSVATWFHEIPEPGVEDILKASMEWAAQGLSEMVGSPIGIADFQVQTIPIAEVTTYAGDPEAEMVGVYLLIKGGLEGQALLLLPPVSAWHLVRLLLGDETGRGSDNGSTPPLRRLGNLETSALAEVGNLMVSYFLNKVAAALGRPRLLYPSPPALMLDMVGAMLDVIATPVAAQSDELLVIACGLETEGRETELIQVHFWILPEPATRIIGIA
ncbi:MAG: hypothetical protein PVJ34_04605 [Anaerolineae bacterium]|jgi:chemotaxis protein CheC